LSYNLNNIVRFEFIIKWYYFPIYLRAHTNHDTMWTDLILPKVTVGPRYVSKVALLNASADGVSEALIAHPRVIVRTDDGATVVDTVIDDLPPYCTRLIDIGALVDGATLEAGSLQIREAECGLVGYGFIVDTETDNFVNADHLFDRHFVVDGTGFTG